MLVDHAAHAFNMAGSLHFAHTEQFSRAANSYLKAYRIHLRMEAYRKAATCLNQAIQSHVVRGRKRAAISKMVWLGQLHFCELGDHVKAQQAFEKAAEWSEDEDCPRSAEILWVHLAEIAVDFSEDYGKAAVCFERAAKQTMIAKTRTQVAKR